MTLSRTFLGCGSTALNMASSSSVCSQLTKFCNPLGFYQRGDPANPLSIETSFLSLELFQQQCNQAFPEGLPSSPQVGNVNKYGGWNMSPSNVMFSNGECRPLNTESRSTSWLPHSRSVADHGPCLNWIKCSTAHAVNGSPRVRRITHCRLKIYTYLLVRRCNTPPVNTSSFFGITYDGMVHVSDMRVLLTPDANHTDFKTVGFYSPVSTQPFYAGLGLFSLALDEWLPCFKPS